MSSDLFQTVRDGLQPRLADVLADILPGGRIVGREYCCASLEGGQGNSCRPICKTASAATLPPENAGRTSSALPRNAGDCAPERRHESWPGGMRFLQTAQQRLPLRRRVPLSPCCLCLLQRRSRRVGMDSWGRIRSFGAIWRLDACLPVSHAFHAKTAARSFCLCPMVGKGEQARPAGSGRPCRSRAPCMACMNSLFAQKGRYCWWKEKKQRMPHSVFSRSTLF